MKPKSPIALTEAHLDVMIQVLREKLSERKNSPKRKFTGKQPTKP